MNNRERILTAALKLFNSRGVLKVSVRDICEDLNISPGNFSYHFPDKELVVSELYHRMSDKIHDVVASIPYNQASVTFFLETHRLIFLIQNEYRFFYLNLFEILTHFRGIKKSFSERYRQEKAFAREFMALYAKKGVLVPGLTDEQYQRLVDVGMILNNAWMVDAEINAKSSMKKKMLHYMQLCCGRLEPYLTAAARKEYQAYFEELANKP